MATGVIEGERSKDDEGKGRGRQGRDGVEGGDLGGREVVSCVVKAATASLPAV